MKYLSLLFLISVLFACNEANETLDTSNTNLSLVSPNGIAVSNSSADLKKEIESAVWDKLGKEETFEIKAIEYIESRTEMLALVEFTSISGISSNIGILMKESEDRKPIKYIVSYVGDCGCKVSGSINTEGLVSFSSACDDCVLSIESD